MKITKRQLQRIIKEERAKLLRESIGDTMKYQDAYEAAAMQIADMFVEDMMKLYDEEPDSFARPGPSGGMTMPDRGDWEQQVVYAAQEIETGLSYAMSSALERIESQLHNGDYDR